MIFGRAPARARLGSAISHRAHTPWNEDDPMTTLANRPHTALLVIDVQRGVVSDTVDRDRVVANIATLVEHARSEGIPVVWVQHSDDRLARGSDDWQYVPELVQQEGEAVVHKRYDDSFDDTDLEPVLAERGVGRLVVAGAQTDACIRSTIHGAFVRGYDVTLVGDAHTTADFSEWGAPPPEQVIAHTNLYWQDQAAPGRRAAVVNTADVSFGADD
jgi:nicotinamidase-related amidase